MRISGELIDAITGRHIWGDRFDGTRGDIFALQDRVAAAVVGAIEPRLRLAEIERVSRKPIENLDAYDLSLRASAQMSKRTERGLAEAVRLLHQVLKLDPDLRASDGPTWLLAAAANDAALDRAFWV